MERLPTTSLLLSLFWQLPWQHDFFFAVASSLTWIHLLYITVFRLVPTPKPHKDPTASKSRLCHH